jgi:phage-related protein
MPPNQPAQLKPVEKAPVANKTADVASSPKSDKPTTQKPADDKSQVSALAGFKSFFTGTSTNSDKISKANAAIANKNTIAQIALHTTSNNLLSAIFTSLNRTKPGDTKKSINTVTVKQEQQKKPIIGQMAEKFTPKGVIGTALFGKKEDTQTLKKSTGEKPSSLGFLGNALFGKKEENKPAVLGKIGKSATQDGSNNAMFAVLNANFINLSTQAGLILTVLENILGVQQSTANSMQANQSNAELSKSVKTEAGSKPTGDKAGFGALAKMFSKSDKKGGEKEGGGLLGKIIGSVVDIILNLVKKAISLVNIITTIVEVIAFAVEVVAFIVEAITIGASMLAAGFSGLLAAILPLILPVLAIIAVLGLIALAAYLIYDNWDTIAKALGGLWDKTFGLFMGMFDEFLASNILGKLYDFFISIPDRLVSWISVALDGIFNFIESIPVMLDEWLMGLFGFNASDYVSAFTDGLDVINEAFYFLVDFFSNIPAYAEPVIAIVENVFDLIIGIFKDYIFGSVLSAWELIKGVFSTIVAEIQIGIALVKGYIDAVWGTIKIVFDAISSIFSTLYDFVTGEISFTDMISKVWDIISSIPMKIWDMLVGVFGSVSSSISSIAGGWFDSMKTMLTNMLDLILAPFKRIGKFFGLGGEEKLAENTVDKKSITSGPPTIEPSVKGPEIKPGQSTSSEAAAPLKQALQTKDELNNQNTQNKVQSVVSQTNQTNISSNATNIAGMVSANNSRSAIPRGV